MSTTFAALADPTRVAIVQRLSAGPATVTSLAEPFEMSLTGFLKHVKVLEDAGLVRTTKEGRVRWCELERGHVESTARWFDDLRQVWERRLDRIERHARQETR